MPQLPDTDVLPRLRTVALRMECRLDRNALMFPGLKPGRMLSDMTLSTPVRRMAVRDLDPDALPRWSDRGGHIAVPHGFHSSFREWTRGTDYADGLCKLAPAHLDGNDTRVAYAREEMMEERRPLIAQWASWGLCVRPAAAPAVEQAPIIEMAAAWRQERPDIGRRQKNRSHARDGHGLCLTGCGTRSDYSE